MPTSQSNQKSNTKIKILEVGKFYFIHDGSETGHPGFIIWKHDERNIYAALKFGTSSNKENILLKTKISLAPQNYLYKKIFIGKRKDFSSKALDDFALTDEICSIFNFIKNNKPIYSKNVSNRIKIDVKTLQIKNNRSTKRHYIPVIDIIKQ